MHIQECERELIIVILGPVMDNDSGITNTDGYRFKQHQSTPWSNLLEAAKNSDLHLVHQLLTEASLQEAQKALSMLDCAINKVNECSARIIYDVPFEYDDEAENYSASIDEESLLQIRQTILSHLTEKHYQDGIKLTKKDKRIIEANLLNKVSQCTSVNQIFTFLTSHEGVLNHLRNPKLAWVRSQLFYSPVASTLKSTVMTALQHRALFLAKQTDTNLDDSTQRKLFQLFSGNIKLSLEFQHCIAQSNGLPAQHNAL